MKKNAVFCVAKDRNQAEAIVDALKSAGIPSTGISVLLPDTSGTRDFAHEQNTKVPKGATTGAVAGMGGGVALGGATGGIIGALVGMGIPEYEAKHYDGKISSGNTLISVHTDDADEEKRVREIYKRLGAEDIKSTSEAAVPSR